MTILCDKAAGSREEEKMQDVESHDYLESNSPISEFSDYIVYVDESGDHSLTTINREFPAFCLSFCVIRKKEYISKVVPTIQNLKFKYWGHDAVILHEREINKQRDNFSWLIAYPSLKKAFFEDLHKAISDSPFHLIGSVIKKIPFADEYVNLYNPYDVALLACLEDLHRFLMEKGQEGKRVHVVFESRGKNENDDLQRAFQRITGGADFFRISKVTFNEISYTANFAKKAVNSTGLQIADLTARPIALKSLRPDQKNRTYSVLEDKLISHSVLPKSET